MNAKDLADYSERLTSKTTPLKTASNWGKVTKVFHNHEVATIDEMLKYTYNSFRHDLWQRLIKPNFNTDPFLMSGYQIFFFVNTFTKYLKAYGIDQATLDLNLLWNIIFHSYVEQNPYRRDELIDYNGEILSKENHAWKNIELKLFVQKLQAYSEFYGMRELIKRMRDSINTNSAEEERAKAKLIFVAIGELIEIALYAQDEITKIVNSNKDYKHDLGKYIEVLNKNSSDQRIIITLMDYMRWLRNTIHIQNLLEKNSNLNYGLNTATSLFSLLRIVLTIFVDNAKWTHGKYTFNWGSDPYEIIQAAADGI